MNDKRLRIAIQKKGRLNQDSLELLQKCGLQFHLSKNTLLCHVENLPIDLLFVRDDDIPTMIMNDICHLGIVGENELLEAKYNRTTECYSLLSKLGFSKCRLSIAGPKGTSIDDIKQLMNKRLATSYPNLLRAFLVENNLDASIVEISGSVEIAPRLDMADAICDLVSTGLTLEENNLTEWFKVIDSQAVLISTKTSLSTEINATIDLLMNRIQGVLKARESKYIMLHAPKSRVEEISNLLPGSEKPTIMSLGDNNNKVAIHAVASEGVFWSTLEELKQAGAESILVMPIEKML